MERNPPILVTGGAGYVGSHAAKALAGAGFTPVTFDNLERGHRWAVKYGPLIEGDLRDSEAIASAVMEVKPVAVMHFAALAYVGESVTEPDLYYQNNVVGTMNLLNAMVAAKVGRLVFSSTCATYGDPQFVPMDETHPQRPVNPYGNTKLAAERMIFDYCQAYDLSAACLRYFNASGADADGELREAHDPETHLIPLTLEATVDRELKIFGDDYDTQDGTCIRDYIHVEDLAAAHVNAIDYLSLKPGWHAFNLGTGRGQSVREIIESVERVTGKKVNYSMAERRPGDPPQLVADARLAQRALNWRCRYDDIDAIVRSAEKNHT